MATIYIAVDGEMTAASIPMGGRLFQLGLVMVNKISGTKVEAGDSLLLNFCPDDFYWSDEAEAVHGYSEEEVLSYEPAETADKKLVEWLRAHGVSERDRAVIIGFNIGAFDLPHIEAVLPESRKLLSHRSIDLNALCFTLEGFDYRGNETEWTGWKRYAKKYAERTIGLSQNSLNTEQAHNALYDAYLHFYAWQFLKSAATGEPLAIPNIPSRDSDVRRALKELSKSYKPEEISRHTGVPEVFVKGWLNGGRATRRDYIDSIIRLVRQ
jgi:hypothetical protein